MLITLLIFLVILLLLVISHEAGHFFSAKFFGIEVEEFGFGLPPRIAGIKKGGTLYSINALPFGGFVKIFGEESDGDQNPKNFSNKPAYMQASVLVSGVLANLLLAYIIFCFISMLGVFKAVDGSSLKNGESAEVLIIDVAPSSPASSAGLAAGDIIERVAYKNDAVTPKTALDIQTFTEKYKGKNLNLTLKRGNNILQKNIFTRISPPQGEGSMGIGLTEVVLEKTKWFIAPIKGAVLTWDALKSTVTGFLGIIAELVSKGKTGAELAGPVGIFNLTSSAEAMGLSTILTLVALLSVNLSVINILPFPGLDGGRLLFLIIEAVRGKRISPKISSWAHSAGLAILIALLLAITYHDITKLF